MPPDRLLPHRLGGHHHRRGDTGIEQVVFVLWGQAAFNVYADTLMELLGGHMAHF